jgi:hypothetical protein
MSVPCIACFGNGLHARMAVCTCPPGQTLHTTPTPKPTYTGDLSICPAFLTEEQFNNLRMRPKYKDENGERIFRHLLAALRDKTGEHLKRHLLLLGLL